MNIYFLVIFILPISGFTITAKVTGQKFQDSEFKKTTSLTKIREISPAQCKTLTRSVRTSLSKSRPVDKLTVKILLKYCMTETRLKLLNPLTSKTKKDSLRW